MSNTDYADEFAANVMEVFQANRPAGVPETVGFFRDTEQGLKVRPCFVAVCDGKNWVHPRMLQATLNVELLVRSGEVTDDQARAWMDAFVAAMPQLVLQAVPDAVALRWIMPLSPESGPVPDGSFRRSSWAIRLVVQ